MLSMPSTFFIRHCRSAVLSLLLCFFPAAAFAEATLCLSGEIRYDRASDGAGASTEIVQAGLQAGLNETFTSFLSVQGMLGIAYAAQPGTAWRYVDVQGARTAAGAWGLTFDGQLALHLPDRWFGILGGVSVTTFFIPGKNGIFRADAFAGVLARIPLGGTLRGFGIGFRYYFGLIDDFKKNFGVHAGNARVSLSAQWEF